MSETFAEVDALIAERDARLHERVDALGAWFIGAATEMDERLRAIDAQNVRLAEMVQILGGYVEVSLSEVERHKREGH